MVKKLTGKDRIDLINSVNAALKTAGGGGGGTTYEAGDGIEISDEDVISAIPYTAGENVAIEDFTVSAIDTTYEAGENVTISEDNVISAKDTTYTAGENVAIENGVISAAGTTYTAGTGIDIQDKVISAKISAGTGISISTTSSGVRQVSTSLLGSNGVKVSGREISGNYTAGDNVTISNAKISAKDTTYTAGTGINISSDYVISATGDTSGNFASYTGTVSGSTTTSKGTTTDNISGFGIVTPYLAFILVVNTDNTAIYDSAVVKLQYSSSTPIETPDTWENPQVYPFESNDYAWDVSIDTTYNEIVLEANNGAYFQSKAGTRGLVFIVPINPAD